MKMMKGEREIIASLISRLPLSDHVILGAGDDCAIVNVVNAFEEDECLLLKVDSIIEGVHFTRKDPAEKVGRKALARCLSDVAAMAGKPDSAVIAIGLPSKEDLPFLEGVYDGIIALAKEFDVSIVGGDLCRNPNGIFISACLTGRVKKGNAVKRSGAKVGDAIFVSGELGGAMFEHHLNFTPRIAQGEWLAENANVHSMIDLSDGLATDLSHLLHASKVGALIDEAFLPIRSSAQKRVCENENSKTNFKTSKTPLDAALSDGEDFELLFTVSSKDALRIKEDWARAFPNLRLSLIGKIEAGSELRLRQKKIIRSIKGVHGFDHFS